jgi:ATP-binding protein involved in chromosome partitioning
MEPLEAHGLQVMSIGFLVDTETPMVWRGPMATQALEQLLKETKWQRSSTTWWSTCHRAPATSS